MLAFQLETHFTRINDMARSPPLFSYFWNFTTKRTPTLLLLQILFHNYPNSIAKNSILFPLANSSPSSISTILKPNSKLNTLSNTLFLPLQCPGIQEQAEPPRKNPYLLVSKNFKKNSHFEISVLQGRQPPSGLSHENIKLHSGMIDMDHLGIGGYVRKERVVGKYKYDNWVATHPGEPIPPRLCASPRQEVEPRRAKEPVRRKDKHATGTSAEGVDVPDGVQWEQTAPNVAHGGCDFEEMQIRFLEDQRKMWKRMEYRQKRLHDRQRRHEEKLRDYFNAQGGPVYPSPTPSPEPPKFD